MPTADFVYGVSVFVFFSKIDFLFFINEIY